MGKEIAGIWAELNTAKITACATVFAVDVI